MRVLCKANILTRKWKKSAYSFKCSNFFFKYFKKNRTFFDFNEITDNQKPAKWKEMNDEIQTWKFISWLLANAKKQPQLFWLELFFISYLPLLRSTTLILLGQTWLDLICRKKKPLRVYRKLSVMRIFQPSQARCDSDGVCLCPVGLDDMVMSSLVQEQVEGITPGAIARMSPKKMAVRC